MSLPIEQVTRITAKLRERRKKALDEAENMKAALHVVQSLCAHQFQEQGHDHNYVYYKCPYCGKDQRV